MICRKGKPLSELVDERIAAYPSSGEINLTVSDAQTVIKAIESQYAPGALDVDYTDGLSVCFADWRFNLRASNTEPVIRLNVESRGDIGLMERETEKLLGAIRAV